MIVGGNIDGFTRTMTTAIALETSKGDLPLAMGLGLMLITLIIAVDALAWGARRLGEARTAAMSDARFPNHVANRMRTPISQRP